MPKIKKSPQLGLSGIIKLLFLCVATIILVFLLKTQIQGEKQNINNVLGTATINDFAIKPGEVSVNVYKLSSLAKDSKQLFSTESSFSSSSSKVTEIINTIKKDIITKAYNLILEKFTK